MRDPPRAPLASVDASFSSVCITSLFRIIYVRQLDNKDISCKSALRSCTGCVEHHDHIIFHVLIPSRERLSRPDLELPGGQFRRGRRVRAIHAAVDSHPDGQAW